MILRRLVCFAALASAGCREAPTPRFQIGSQLAGGSIPVDAPGTSLVWVLQPADYVQCATHAREVRRVQRQASREIPLTVVAVGDHEEWARAFVARERLDAKVVVLTPREYRREFGRRPVSALYVVSGKRVHASFSVVERTEMQLGELSRVLAGVNR